ncbi:MAG TPA: hypothetical protein DDW50_21735 [Firmicutes bacterium]|jgi:tetratricopeptide (TPR) repeat protein|nr:hypothetical protein [Bacillota bacterium]
MFRFQPLNQHRKNSIDFLFAKAKELHQLGVDGERNAVKEAFALLERIRRFNPNHPLVNAYYGSTIALLGRDAIDMQERTEKAEAGLKILDHAVSCDPDNVEIRILRGYVSYRLPNMYFRRTKTATEDFEYLVSRFEQDPDIFPDEFYCQILYDLGTSYRALHQEQNAEDTWKKLLERTSDPKYRDLISKKTNTSN